jgi:hypothetical protein
MYISNEQRYLLPRFAVRILSDLAVREKDSDRVVFTANNVSRTFGSGVQAPRGTDGSGRATLAVEALVRYGLNRVKAARIVSKIITHVEGKSQQLASRWPRHHRPVEFRFGRAPDRGRRLATRQLTSQSKVPHIRRIDPQAWRHSRLAELDDLIARDSINAPQKNDTLEKRRANIIRIQTLGLKQATPNFESVFENAFSAFCADRAARTRSRTFFVKAEAAHRERLKSFEEPDQKLNDAYDLGRVTHRCGLALLLHERGEFDAALQFYEDAAERLRLSEFPFLPEYRQEALNTLMHAIEDCWAGRPPRRRV